MTKGTIKIDYECEPADMSDPMSGDYFDILAIRNDSDEVLKLRVVDEIMLRKALETALRHCS